MKKKIKEITSVFSQDNPKIKKQIDKVKEKGHQRMTILVIPHGYDSSFHFQISHFTILFFLGLTLGLLSLAIFGIVRSNNTQTQINQLSKIYGTYFLRTEIVSSLTYSMTLMQIHSSSIVISEHKYSIGVLAMRHPCRVNAGQLRHASLPLEHRHLAIRTSQAGAYRVLRKVRAGDCGAMLGH